MQTAKPKGDISAADGWLFAAGCLYAVLAWLCLHLGFPQHGIIWTAGFVFMLFLYRSRSALYESTVLLLVAWIMSAHHFRGGYLFDLPLVITVLLWSAWKLGGSWAWLSLLPAGLWMYSSWGQIAGWGGLGLWFSAGLAQGIYWLAFKDAGRRAPLHDVDVLLCSYTGNTAHYADFFAAGMRRAGTEAVIHRFHDPGEFRPQLTGEALVLAFPVAGWKPPWPLAAYLLRHLPPGRGKPAFILYTAMGGPENAGIVAWVLLKLKGYRVAGRLWAAYPNNVATFRLGTTRMWKWLDLLVPEKIEPIECEQAGWRFARGERGGLPFILWPFPLWIAGWLLDNSWLDRILYRNWVMRKRCTGCGACIRRCPAKRLQWVNGYPEAKGTCHLCFMCVNLCPANAMHLAGFTEYGRPYRPRWPKGVIKAGIKESC